MGSPHVISYQNTHAASVLLIRVKSSELTSTFCSQPYELSLRGQTKLRNLQYNFNATLLKIKYPSTAAQPLQRVKRELKF